MRVLYFNLEITWMEVSNELMIREGDYESGDQDVATQRFVRLTSSGAQIDSNTVLCSMFRNGGTDSDGSEAGDSAVLAGDVVGHDELYPYHPSERLRQDITSVLTLRAYPRKTTAKDGHKNKEVSSGTVIVLRRSFYGRLHKSELKTPPDVVEGVKCGSNFWFKTMLRIVGEIVKISPLFRQ